MKGYENVGKFNLLDEPWISVLTKRDYQMKLVSLKEVFENAHLYDGLAGDTKTQDFAVMRVLLAVLHTVFSRFNAEGEEYGFFELDDKWGQVDEIIDEDDAEEYEEELYNTWHQLWDLKAFPSVIGEYLEKWRDRFYLFDEEYPFFQVTEEEIAREKLLVKGKSPANPTGVLGHSINRLISESSSKKSIFAPKHDRTKKILSPPEIIRWIITYQGYSNTSDEAVFAEKRFLPGTSTTVTTSKGWLYNLGGVFFTGYTLFDTLMLNFPIVHPMGKYRNQAQKPCWERKPTEVLEKLLEQSPLNNLAELYTHWGRAIYIDPQFNWHGNFEMNVVKIPEIDRVDQFLEPMTLWYFHEGNKYNREGFRPLTHDINQSIWQSFGLLTQSYLHTESIGINHPQCKPGIMVWLERIHHMFSNVPITIHAVSMRSNNKPNSWTPIDEIIDVLDIQSEILTDIQEAGWISRIVETVAETKTIASQIYKHFLNDIGEIRIMRKQEEKGKMAKKIESKTINAFIDRNLQNFYFDLNDPFKEWIAALQPNDSKDERIFEWRKVLKQTALRHAENILKDIGPKDYTGFQEDGELKNVITVYNRFRYRLNEKLPLGGGKKDGENE